MCVLVCVSHQVGPSSPVEEESIWVNLQGHQGGGATVWFLHEKRYGAMRETDTAGASCPGQRTCEDEEEAGELMSMCVNTGNVRLVVQAGRPCYGIQFISSQSGVYKGELV